MDNTLHIVDISPACYAGSYNPRGFIPGNIINTPDGYREQRIPVGGTSMLFNILGQYMGTGKFAFVADRDPTIKKELFPDYKSSRTHPANVMMHKAVAEFILQDCGFEIFAADGYEADDIIYTLCLDNVHLYDHIYIHTGDSDLYSLVSPKVSILPTSSQAKTVTMENYETVILPGRRLQYNCVLFRKLLRGDKSKGLASISDPQQDKLCEFYLRDGIREQCGVTSFMLSTIKQVAPELETRVKLLWPMRCPEINSYVTEGDRDRVQGWAKAIGNRRVPHKNVDVSNKIDELLANSMYIE